MIVSFLTMATDWRPNDFNIVGDGAVVTEVLSANSAKPLGPKAAETLTNKATSNPVSSTTIKWYCSGNDKLFTLKSTTSTSNEDNLLRSDAATGSPERTE